GDVKAIIFCAFVKSLYISVDIFPNFLFSLSSNKYDFTTLIPLTFSSTTLFRSSYLLNTLSNIGCTLLIMKYKAIPTTGISSKNINDSFIFIENAIINENISISGVLTTILVII